MEGNLLPKCFAVCDTDDARYANSCSATRGYSACIIKREREREREGGKEAAKRELLM